MGEDFSPTLLSYETHSPTRQAGWGLKAELGIVELSPSGSLKRHFHQATRGSADAYVKHHPTAVDHRGISDR